MLMPIILLWYVLLFANVDLRDGLWQREHGRLVISVSNSNRAPTFEVAVIFIYSKVPYSSFITFVRSTRPASMTNSR